MSKDTAQPGKRGHSHFAQKPKPKTKAKPSSKPKAG